MYPRSCAITDDCSKSRRNVNVAIVVVAAVAAAAFFSARAPHTPSEPRMGHVAGIGGGIVAVARRGGIVGIGGGIVSSVLLNLVGNVPV